MADRYYLPQWNDGETCDIAGPEFHHLVHVMRTAPGDRIEVFDGRGNVAAGELVQVSAARAAVRLLDRRSDSPPEREVILATAIPKSDRFRFLVEKATELGVGRLIPLQTTRSVVHPGQMKLEKMRLAVIEACKQSGRNRLMSIDPPIAWEPFVDSIVSTGATFVADPAGEPIANVISSWPKEGPVVLAVGPEGGLAEIELRRAREAGGRTISLGPRILRIETAALALAVVFGLK